MSKKHLILIYLIGWMAHNVDLLLKSFTIFGCPVFRLLTDDAHSRNVSCAALIQIFTFLSWPRHNVFSFQLIHDIIAWYLLFVACAVLVNIVLDILRLTVRLLLGLLTYWFCVMPVNVNIRLNQTFFYVIALITMLNM